MARYDLLLADADGTLLDFEAAEHKALLSACEAVGLTVTEDGAARYKAINQQLWRAFERREVTQEALKVLRFSRFLDELGADADPNGMSDAFVRALSLQTDEIEGAYAFLGEASKRVPVVVVTNGIPFVQRGRFGSSRLSKFLSGYVISGEAGFAKPDPRMIEKAMEGRSMPKARALMLGDEPNSDIAAANAFGIDSCWYNPAGRANETPHRQTFTIQRLSEALQWL